VGAPVPLILRVTNTSDDPVTLQLLGRSPVADFRVTDAEGTTVWTRLRGHTMLGILRLHEMAPGAELVFRDIWDGRGADGTVVAAGEYSVCGILMTDDPRGLPSAAVALRVEP